LRNSKGFTLIELIITIIVLIVGVVGIGVVYVNTVGHSAEPYLRRQAKSALNQVMTDIMSKKFDNDTPDGGGVIPLSEVNIGREKNDGTFTQDFDDVDDFNGLDCDTGVDTCFPDVPSGFHVKIGVSYVDVQNGKITKSSRPTNFKLITVTLYSRGLKHEEYTVEAVKGNF